MLSGKAVVPDWQSNTVYHKDSYVEVNGIVYRATVSHTSATKFSTDARLSKWEPVCASIADWVANSANVLGVSKSRNFRLYKNIQESYSSTFTKLNWRPYIPVIDDWMPYIGDKADGLLLNMRFNSVAEAYLDDLGHDCTVLGTATRGYPQLNIGWAGSPPSGYGNFCGSGNGEGGDSNGVQAGCDMRDFVPGAIDGYDVLEYFSNRGGITIEAYQFFAGDFINMIHQILIMVDITDFTHAICSNGRWVTVGTGIGWHHLSLNYNLYY